MMNKLTRGKYTWWLDSENKFHILVDGEELLPTFADIELFCSALELFDIVKDLSCASMSSEEASKFHDFLLDSCIARARVIVNRIEEVK